MSNQKTLGIVVKFGGNRAKLIAVSGTRAGASSKAIEILSDARKHHIDQAEASIVEIGTARPIMNFSMFSAFGGKISPDRPHRLS